MTEPESDDGIGGVSTTRRNVITALSTVAGLSAVGDRAAAADETGTEPRSTDPYRGGVYGAREYGAGGYGRA